MTDTPAVSVLMAVRDGAPWVTDAVDSILGQSHADLELIVIDDGSTDSTAALLARIRDARLHVHRRPASGLTRALNYALGRARGDLVARLDADDLARPERLARQLQFLRAHPGVVLVGSAAVEVDADGRELRVVRPPVDDVSLRRALIRRNPFVHSSVVFRRGMAVRLGGYDESLAVAQDYDLWLRLSGLGQLANLADVLVVRRLLPGRVTARRDDERLRTEMRVRWRAVRSGAYPRWCALFALRPAVALALPLRIRRALRRLVSAAGA